MLHRYPVRIDRLFVICHLSFLPQRPFINNGIDLLTEIFDDIYPAVLICLWFALNLLFNPCIIIKLVCRV
jgi:hypothetical protein